MLGNICGAVENQQLKQQVTAAQASKAAKNDSFRGVNDVFNLTANPL